MIKALGAVLLAGGSFCFGEHRARLLKARVEVLDRLLVGLEGLSRELELRLAPLPQLMEELSVQVEPPVRDLFLSCRKAMEGLRQESFA